MKKIKSLVFFCTLLLLTFSGYSQTRKIVNYPNGIGGGSSVTSHVSGSIVPLNDDKLLYFPNHFEGYGFSPDPNKRRAFLYVLNSDLSVNRAISISGNILSKGATLENAIKVPDTDLHIIQGYTTRNSTYDPFVFLMDVENEILYGDIIFLRNSNDINYNHHQVNYGMEIVEDQGEKCLVVFTNGDCLKFAPGPAGFTDWSAMSVLNLIHIDVAGAQLIYNVSYDIISNPALYYQAKDMVVDGNKVYTLSRSFLNLGNILTECRIQFTGSDFIASGFKHVQLQRNISGNTLVLEELELLNNGKLLLTGQFTNSSNNNFENCEISLLSENLSSLFNYTTSQNLPMITISHPTQKTVFYNSILDPNNNQIVNIEYNIESATNIFQGYPALFQFNLSTNNLVKLNNSSSTNFNSVSFNRAPIEEYMVGLRHNLNSLNYNFNKTKLLFTGRMLHNPTIFEHEYNGLGFPYSAATEVGDTLCDYPAHILEQTDDIVVLTPLTINVTEYYDVEPQESPSLKPYERTHLIPCESNCQPVEVVNNDCDAIELGINGQTDINWTVDNNNSTSNSIFINDTDCHSIVYEINDIECEFEYKACISLGQFDCGTSPRPSNDNTNDSRWTLNDKVVKLESMQSEIKNQLNNTICFETFDQKKNAYIKVYCETFTTSNNPNELIKVNSLFKVYPTLANDFVNIEKSVLTNEGDYRFVLFSEGGINVREGKITDTNTRISLNDLSNGNYFISIFDGINKIMTEKVIVNK